MGMRYCPTCMEVVETRVLGGNTQIETHGIAGKKRKVIHRAQDNGCGHEWYTVEVPEDVLEQNIKMSPNK